MAIRAAQTLLSRLLVPLVGGDAHRTYNNLWESGRYLMLVNHDPLNEKFNDNLGQVYRHANRYEASVDRLKKNIDTLSEFPRTRL